VPADGHQLILQLLDSAQISHRVLIDEADHTFIRDDGYRFDPVSTDSA
jgi:carboxymethylenebutenolidase